MSLAKRFRELERRRRSRPRVPFTLDQAIATLKALWKPSYVERMCYPRSPMFGLFCPQRWAGPGWVNRSAVETRTKLGLESPL